MRERHDGFRGFGKRAICSHSLRRMAAGEWQPGEALPTVAVLAEHYVVSKATVTRTLRIPADEGLVRVVPRWGTFRA
jgi:DNA-binding GntR family transcriptional regulator